MHTVSKLFIAFLSVMLAFGSIEVSAANSCGSLFLGDSFHVPETGAQIQEMLSADPKLRSLLDSDAGVSEGYSIRKHNEMVYGVFEKILPQFKKHPLFKESSSIRAMELLKVTIALHDIGKPIAVQHGNKDDQHVYTLPILSRELSKWGFTESEIRIARALVDNDVFGDLLKGKISVDEAVVSLRKLSQRAGMDLASFTTLQALFYIIDAASYPKLHTMLFSYDREGNLIPTNQLYENLMSRVANRKPRNLLEPLKYVVPELQSAAWAQEHFSDPRKHDPNSYKYLIHGSWGMDLFTSFMRRGVVDSFSQISLSAIDPSHTNTFSPIGLILDVPKENIFAASSSDMLSGSIQKDGKNIRAADYIESLPALYKEHGLPSPEEVLAKTQARPAKNAFGHNEVIASSLGLNGNGLKVKGVFYSVDSLGHPMAKPQLLSAVKSLAAKYSFPIVPIEPSKGFFTIQVDVKADLSNFTENYVQVHASKEEFEMLVVKAKAANVNLVGVELGSSLSAGAFRDGKFFRFQEANTTPEKLSSVHPSMVFSVQFVP